VPRKITRQLEAFAASPGADMVFGHVRQFLSPDLEPGTGRAVPTGLELMPGYSTGTLLARASVFQRVGPFARALRVGEFLEWYGRAMDAGLRSEMLDEVLLHRRIHADNMGVRERDKRSDYLKVFKAALDRRRQASADSDRSMHSHPASDSTSGTEPGTGQGTDQRTA
jgi:hypothetical protein